MRRLPALAVAAAAVTAVLPATPALSTSPREMQVSVVRGDDSVPAVPRGQPRGEPLRVAGGARLRINTSRLVATARVWLANARGRRFGRPLRVRGVGPAVGGSTRRRFRVQLPSRIPRRTGVLVLGFRRRGAPEALYEIAVCGRFRRCQ